MNPTQRAQIFKAMTNARAVEILTLVYRNPEGIDRADIVALLGHSQSAVNHVYTAASRAGLMASVRESGARGTRYVPTQDEAVGALVRGMLGIG